jgi:hypothetical protein
MVDVEEAIREALGSPRRSPASPKDLWAEVQRRIRRRSRRRRRALLGGVAMVVAGAASATLALGSTTNRAERAQVIDAGPGPTSTAAPEVDEQGWFAIVPPTIEARDGATVTSSGERLILWGGEPETDEPYGMIYYPSSASWGAIPDSPLAPRSDHISAWTGRELVVWGGHATGHGWLVDGAAFDPVSATWRSIAPAPLPADRYSGVWTGSELIVVGGGEATVTGAAYDPATDTWRTISPPPVALVRYQLAWTGQRVLAVGGERTGEATEQQFRALAYEPGRDTWVDLGGHEIASNEVAIAVTDGQLVVWSNGGDDTWRFDLATGAWSPGAPAPTTCEGADRAVGIPGAVIGAICGRGYRYDVVADTWTELDWPDDRWIVAGDQVFVPA